MRMKNEEVRMKNGDVPLCSSMFSVGNVFRLFLHTLREIFDENAYARFLQLRRLEPSRDSYAAFLREDAFRRGRRPRCC